MKETNSVILAAVIGAIIGGAIAITTSLYLPTPEAKLIEDWYSAENLIHVSPHHIRKHMAIGDDTFILVDLRSDEEYTRQHIIGAVNIPAYKDPYKSAYGDVERITNGFRDLIERNPGVDIIVYCYSIPCMTGRKIGKMLADQGIYVQHLGVGWNEWKYYWNLWNHEHEWNNTLVEDYLWSGPDPGVVGNVSGSGCKLGGEFGC